MTLRISYWLEKEVKIVWPWTAPHFPPLPEIFDRWNGGTRALSDYNTAAAARTADSRANWHHLRNSVDNAPPNDRSRLLPFQPKDIFTPSANPQCSSLMRAKTPHLSELFLVNKYQLSLISYILNLYQHTEDILSTWTSWTGMINLDDQLLDQYSYNVAIQLMTTGHSFPAMAGNIRRPKMIWGKADLHK